MNEVRELLERLEIPFRARGGDYLVKCTNPEHDDSHPSMSIDKIQGIYHCFSCGHKGNILKDYNIKTSLVNKKAQTIRNKIVALRNVSLELPVGAQPFNMDYRGISIKTYQRFGAFTDPMLESNIVFPCKDISGNIICFISRHLYSNVKPKYKISPPDTRLPLFPNKPVNIINNSIILVEGIFDALNLIDKGLDNVLCAFGTHTLNKNTKDKLSFLKLMGVEKINIMFDGDIAGIKAAKELEEIIKKTEMFDVEVIELPKDVDPGDLTKSEVMLIKNGMYK